MSATGGLVLATWSSMTFAATRDSTAIMGATFRMTTV